MRRLWTIASVIVALMLMIGAVGCGAASSANPAAGALTAEDILAGLAASEDMAGAAGSFDVNLSIDADTSGMPAESKALLEKPMTLRGTFAYTENPQAAELTTNLSMNDQMMDAGIKLVQEKLWLSLAGRWYEAPPEMQQTLANSLSSEQQARVNKLRTLAGEAGIDPVTWFKDLRLVGEEEIDGEAVYHLAGSPDADKIAADMATLLQDKQFMDTLSDVANPTGAMSDATETEDVMPAADELQGLQTQVANTFQDFTLDLWVSADDVTLRKVTVDIHMTPPTTDNTTAIKAVTLTATVSVADLDGQVKIEPPASPLPFSALEEALQENPSLFLGPLAPLLGLEQATSYGTTSYNHP